MTLGARERLPAWGALGVLAALGWITLARVPMMPMPDAGIGPQLALAFAMWSVMMVAMMLPSMGPALSAYGRLARTRAEAGLAWRCGSLVAGYLAAWTAFAALAAPAQDLLLHAALVSPMLASKSNAFSIAVLLAAGLYQLTPLKRACMTKCRSPIGLFLGSWRDGAGGAFSMGLRLGGYCVACCWALMAVMLVVGAMSLAWMAALTALVALEKLAPARWRLDTLAGAALIAGAIATALKALA